MKKIEHPYKEYEQTQLWELIDKAIDDLIQNQDIELTTRKEYVVGYLCKNIKIGVERGGKPLRG
ncbi:hypothetical protein [Parapedobacter tibetensis]|uniref:hypothetical protein n=1 Tax=Parapedobacter tibetensis TaxID=2972951 RepID=UPI00214D908D|nr:hypothetical protein [Parapedobacter tibetensis]